MHLNSSVEALEARIAPAHLVVTSVADHGPGSLRSAIERANATPEHDEITFAIGNQTFLHIETALPALAGGITIDGILGTKNNTRNAGLQGPDDLLISGLTLAGDDNVVRHLDIANFQVAGIDITGNNNLVAACYIHSLRDAAHGNGVGIRISGDRNLIGAPLEFPNVIEYNRDAGILVAGTVADPASGNLINTNNISYNGKYGIDVQHADGTAIGGAGLYTQSNTLRGHTVSEIRISGADAINTSIRANTFTSYQTSRTAILVDGGAHGVVIGGPNGGSNNFGHGLYTIRVADGFGVTVESNTDVLIDIGPAGTQPNDSLDQDTGANGLLNSPVLSASSLEFGQERVSGVYDGAPNKQFRVIFTRYEGGYFGETLITTDANGHAAFEALLDVNRFRGGGTTARVIDVQTGDTSEESDGVYNLSSTPKIRLNDASVAEADSDVVLKFKLQLGHVATQPVSVTVTPVALTALAGTDFTFATQTITFQPGETELTIPVTVKGDDLREDIESFRLDLSAPVNGVLDSAHSSAFGKIRDDDNLITISPNHKMVTWTDVDGDLVTLKSNHEIFDDRQFTFLPTAVAGSAGQLAKLDLTNLVTVNALGTPISYDLVFSVKKASTGLPGDGKVDVGFIDAGGIRLGLVALPGDLGQIHSGSDQTYAANLRNFTVDSFGARGLATQAVDAFPEEASLESVFYGKIRNLKVLGDIRGATLTFNASEYQFEAAGNIFIGGDLVGGDTAWSGSINTVSGINRINVGGSLMGGSGAWSGAIHTGLSLLKVDIKGDLLGGTHVGDPAIGSGSLSAGGALGSVNIGGAVTAGDSDLSGSIFTTYGSGGDIGAVTIGKTLNGRGRDFAGAEIFTGISSAGRLGKVKVDAIAGAAADSPVRITAAGEKVIDEASDAFTIAGLTVKHAVTNAEVLAGFDLRGAGTNAHVQIGAVSVGGDWSASRMFAGATLLNGGSAVNSVAGVFDLVGVISKIAKVNIKGVVDGTAPQVSGSDIFGFTANQIGAFKAAGQVAQLHPNAPGVPLDEKSLGTTGDTLLREIL